MSSSEIETDKCSWWLPRIYGLAARYHDHWSIADCVYRSFARETTQDKFKTGGFELIHWTRRRRAIRASKMCTGEHSTDPFCLFDNLSKMRLARLNLNKQATQCGAGRPPIEGPLCLHRICQNSYSYSKLELPTQLGGSLIESFIIRFILRTGLNAL